MGKTPPHIDLYIDEEEVNDSSEVEVHKIRRKAKAQNG
jgi:hypothetical protein